MPFIAFLTGIRGTTKLKSHWPIKKKRCSLVHSGRSLVRHLFKVHDGHFERYDREDCRSIYGRLLGVWRLLRESCLENLEKVLVRCVEKNLVLNWEKCYFMVTQGIVSGHIVSSKGIKVDKVKIDLISNLPTPKCVKDIRSFSRACWFLPALYQRFQCHLPSFVPPPFQGLSIRMD